MKFKKAIVKIPAKSMIKGLTTQNLGLPDYNLAIKQHKQYQKALEKAGLELLILKEQEEYPDSCFVEDTAVLTNDFAIITNPGAASRKGETKEIEKTISELYKEIHNIRSLGTIDGGDVLQVEKSFYVGISKRTNLEGANQFKNIVGKYGYKTYFIELRKYLHLKTGIAYLGNNNLVLAGELKDHPLFNKFNKLLVDDNEEYAANCIKVNDYVLIAKGFPRLKNKIENKGYKTIELDMSEFRKIDGGLSCLSLRF